MSIRLYDAAGVSSLLQHLSSSLDARLEAARGVVVIGVRRGGVSLTRRLAAALRDKGRAVDEGTVDISLYRDDAHLTWPQPEVGPTQIDTPLDARDVVIVDDVFWTGRTARAAMDAVLDFGRPRRLWLLTLAERSGRELPIAPDLVGAQVDAAPHQKVELRLTEDGFAEDELVLIDRVRG